MQTTFVPFQQTRHSRSRSRSLSPTPDWRLQKPFGAGLSRRPVKFVPASDSDTTTGTSTVSKAPARSGTDISSLYLSLVGLAPNPSPPTPTPTPTPTASISTPEICPDCSLPITTTTAAHATSTAHLSALPHAHPPHPYDRSSKGLKVLISSGWDPDARVGLGPEGEGMRYPLKTVQKDDRLGVGLKARQQRGEAPAKVVKREGVKEARRREAVEKKRRGRLMGELGGGVDVEEVLNRRME